MATPQIKAVVFDSEGTLIDGLSMIAGLEEMLAALQARGLRLAIVTGGGHKVQELYNHHNIKHFFTSIVHSDRTSRAKPDPEGFLLAMDECGTFPRESIMVGDSPNDIFTGKNAGARYTIGISHGYDGHEVLQAADPDYIVHSLPELSELILRLSEGQWQ